MSEESNKKQRAKSHHVVSDFYLRGFADPGERISTYDCQSGKIHTKLTKNTAVETNYFSLPSEDNIAKDEYESFLGKHEGSAAKALQKLRDKSGGYSLDDRKAIATWLAYQHVRVRKHRESFANTNSLALQILAVLSGKVAVRSWIERNEGKPISDAALEWEWQDLTQPGGTEIEVPPIGHINLIENLVPTVAAQIWKSQWTYFYFDRKTLLTCDTPVFLMPGPDQPAEEAPGLRNAVGWLVPLSRKIGLAIDYSTTGPDLHRPGNTFVGNLINRVTVESAQSYVYFHPEDISLIAGLGTRESPPKGNQMVENFLSFANSPDWSPSKLPTFPVGQSKGMALEDFDWPLDGRKRSRPASL